MRERDYPKIVGTISEPSPFSSNTIIGDPLSNFWTIVWFFRKYDIPRAPQEV